MSEKRQKAIRNNNDLYREIFAAQDIESSVTDKIWYCLDETPPFYSNLVTISENWQPDKIFRKIDLKFEVEKWDEWSIKDSFSRLDLTGYGFKKLFDACWIYLEAANFCPVPVNDKGNLRFEVIKGENALTEWRLGWDTDEELGKKIFDQKLLKSSRVYFIAGYSENRIVCGCFINRTENVFGISNFFAPENKVECWSETINFVFDSIERLDIVGYEREELAVKLQTLGFETVGDLAVWLKK